MAGERRTGHDLSSRCCHSDRLEWRHPRQEPAAPLGGAKGTRHPCRGRVARRKAVAASRPPPAMAAGVRFWALRLRGRSASGLAGEIRPLAPTSVRCPASLDDTLDAPANAMKRTAIVQTRGRVTLPLAIRQALQIAPGDDVVFIETAPGRFELKAQARRAALLNRPHASRLEVARPRRLRQLELSLAASERTR